MVHAITTNYQIKKFLNENQNSTLHQIKTHLEQLKEPIIYNQRQGLIKKLNALVEAEEITKDIQSNPPSYSIVKDHALDSAIMGDMFRSHFFAHTMGLEGKIDKDYYKDIVNYSSKDNFETKFVKNMITRYGSFLFSVFIKGFEQSITNKNFNKKAWLGQALDLFKDEEDYSQWFLEILFNKQNINIKDIDNKQLENKIKRVKQSMKTLYPKLHQNLIQYEGSMEVEDDFNIVKDLKKNKQFMKRKSFTKR